MERVSFTSDGLKLSGLLHIPEDLKAGERRPAFVVMHGFGGSNQGGQGAWAAKALARWGYICLQFEFRGCGDSEGEKGRIICLDDVTRGKPAPDMFLLAAKKMRTAPADSLAIDDNVHGIAAALSAGMHAIGYVGASHNTPDQAERLIAAGAEAVCNDIGAFAALLETRGWLR